jgi:hypothetical protein
MRRPPANLNEPQTSKPRDDLAALEDGDPQIESEFVGTQTIKVA